MSNNWVDDIETMQDKFGTLDWIFDNKKDKEKLKTFLEFRINFIQEELDETKKAFETLDGEELVDGLIDLCVVAIGTLDAFGVDAYKAWDEVLKANMSKKVGIKEGRPNPLGLPDLMKPEDWKAPSHAGNHGIFNDIR
jgi:hypothetical protein|tara:strand:- start:144 stop:557 length:414 start_codon:yes stop_codon:yes gene_type:complete